MKPEDVEKDMAKLNKESKYKRICLSCAWTECGLLM